MAIRKVFGRLSTKLPIIIVGIALGVASSVGIASFMTAQSNADKMSHSSVSALLKSRSHELKGYLNSIDQDLRIVAENPSVIEALKTFKTSWDALGTNQTQTLQKAYITDNPNPLGQKEKLDVASTGTAYDKAHQHYHIWLRKLLQERQYYDIFLFDTQGNLIYTVFKELDYATNLNTGEWKNSDLGNAYRSAMAATKPGAISFYDFKPYAPSHGAPASFMATPVFENGKKIGALVFQMPIDALNTLMSNNQGLGKTGEALIVGTDGLMRNDSTFTKENDILKTKIENTAITSALAGKQAQTTSNTYRAIELDYTAQPFVFHGVKWALVAAQGTAELAAPIYKMGYQILLTTALMLALAGVIGFFISRSITGKLLLLVTQMKTLAEGDTTVELTGEKLTDEIGDMTRAVAVFRDNAIEREKLQSESEKGAIARLEREKRVDSLIAGFRNSIASAIAQLSENSSQMKDTVGIIADAAASTSTQASNANTASSEASQNVQAVASAAEELSASINEISTQIADANNTLDRAATAAQTTDTRVADLSGAAQKIGEVVSLIEDIAEQTNLLALNATIEAARAGESGKGFAVVAAEVKGLATQTAKATENIGEQIKNIQTETDAAVTAIREILQIMQDVTVSTNAIAAAVEEQGTATTEISRNVQQAATGSNTVAESIQGVTNAAGEASQSVGQIEQAAQGVALQAEELRTVVDEFLDQVAAA